jgi:Flp pilus assembly protein TadB
MVMELNKTIQDLKLEVDTIKKTQSETTLEIENLGKKSGTIDASISNRIQEMEERISGAEDSIENIVTTIKENTKCKKVLHVLVLLVLVLALLLFVLILVLLLLLFLLLLLLLLLLFLLLLSLLLLLLLLLI